MLQDAFFYRVVEIVRGDGLMRTSCLILPWEAACSPIRLRPYSPELGASQISVASKEGRPWRFLELDGSLRADLMLYRNLVVWPRHAPAGICL